MAGTAKDLRDYHPDVLIAEFRRREALGGRSNTAIPAARIAAVSTTAESDTLAAASDKELVEALRFTQKVIYGSDDRREEFQIDRPQAKANARGVVSVIDMGDIQDNGNGTSTIRTVKFGDSHQLCSGERFRDQPTSPFCTGFLVEEDVVATAGHCIDNNTLARTRFVFGFYMKPDGSANVVIPNSDIFKGIAILARKLESAGADFALVRLDKPVQGRPVLSVRRTGKIQDGGRVYVIGHPSGLPLKYAPGAAVRDNNADEYFVANLDTYGGNSGSPVFNGDSDEVEGILVRGETDFVVVNGCRVSNVCPTTGCRGEDVTRATEFSSFLSEERSGRPQPDAIETRVEKLESQVEEILNVVKSLGAAPKKK